MKLFSNTWWKYSLRFILAMMLCMPVLCAQAQQKAGAKEIEIVESPEVMPAFIGNLHDYLSKTLRYPDSALAHGVEGKSVVKFVVSNGGYVNSVTIAKSSGNKYLDEEAVRVIRQMEWMKHWMPGTVKGIPVSVYFTLPVSFTLK